MANRIDVKNICAIVLAGGRGSRMGGVDKGLQLFRGVALAKNAMLRLQNQSLGPPGKMAFNANRNQEIYAQWGAPVWPDAMENFPGPLAGFLTGLQRCHETPPSSNYVLTVPCDSPLFPLDLIERLATALLEQSADIALASAPELDANGEVIMRAQPVFCLMKSDLHQSLLSFVDAGGRKIRAWTGQHKEVLVRFDTQQDSPSAFLNVNSLAELHQLELE